VRFARFAWVPLAACGGGRGGPAQRVPTALDRPPCHPAVVVQLAEQQPLFLTHLAAPGRRGTGGRMVRCTAVS